MLDDIATTMHTAWRGAPIVGDSALSPEPVHIPLPFGGRSKATLRRASTIGDGWVAGALRDYNWQGEFLDLVRKGWQEAGQTRQPQNQPSVNFAIGSQQVANPVAIFISILLLQTRLRQLNIDDIITAPHAQTVFALGCYLVSRIPLSSLLNIRTGERLAAQLKRDWRADAVRYLAVRAVS